MKSRIRQMAIGVLALFLAASMAHAQINNYEQASYSQPELEQMLAPIALYPDSLLSHVLMAATYPTEVVEAAYWLRANPGIQGEAAIRAAEGMQWDISVKSLLPFPHLLNTMESRYDWTQNLGNAFLGQQAQVMDTIQVLRHRAMTAGYLHSDRHITVTREGSLISIMPSQTTLVYLPYYNPRVVYGRWPQPAYAPVYWSPWPGYAVRTQYSGWTWTPVATVVTAGVLFAIFDWHHHHVYQRPQVSYWRHHPHYAHHHYVGPQHAWRHDPRHRREVPYHNARVERHYGPTARAYNHKMPARPTAHDIRAGRAKPQSAGKPHDSRDNHYKPNHSTAPHTNNDHRAAPNRMQATSQQRHESRPASMKNTNGSYSNQAASHEKNHRETQRHDARPSSARNVNGGRAVHPSANGREHQETKRQDDRRQASAKGNHDHRRDSDSRDDDKRRRD